MTALKNDIKRLINYYQMINGHSFYNTYHGHTLDHLKVVCTSLGEKQSIVYLAGDSSLDNKYWLLNRAPIKDAVNGYQDILNPAFMVPDIAYHLNNIFQTKQLNMGALNCAVEESTLANREGGFKSPAKLLPQDEFIRDNIRAEDVLIVSVGGNDIALRPSFRTIWNMLKLMKFNSKKTISDGPNAAWGMPYFVDMFNNRVGSYLKMLTSKCKPRKIIVCTIYYPDERNSNSWASKPLGMLGYNTDPGKLQEAIKQIYIHATSKIKIPGTEVIACPLFEILDGKTSQDYVERVEPSESGGLKMAEAFAKLVV